MQRDKCAHARTHNFYTSSFSSSGFLLSFWLVSHPEALEQAGSSLKPPEHLCPHLCFHLQISQPVGSDNQPAFLQYFTEEIHWQWKVPAESMSKQPLSSEQGYETTLVHGIHLPCPIKTTSVSMPIQPQECLERRHSSQGVELGPHRLQRGIKPQ